LSQTNKNITIAKFKKFSHLNKTLVSPNSEYLLTLTGSVLYLYFSRERCRTGVAMHGPRPRVHDRTSQEDRPARARSKACLAETVASMEASLRSSLRKPRILKATRTLERLPLPGRAMPPGPLQIRMRSRHAVPVHLAPASASGAVPVLTVTADADGPRGGQYTHRRRNARAPVISLFKR
jgi:hypothetical protein